MSDKNLTELEWKKFSKGKNLKDAAFVKALAAPEKAKAPDEQLAALDEIDQQADALRKANKAGKDMASYLNDTDKASGKERKLAKFEAKKAAEKEDAGGGEEAESPALLTSKMIPLNREVKEGEVVMQALIALAGKETVVLLSRNPISAARGKLLKDPMTSPGGPKFCGGRRLGPVRIDLHRDCADCYPPSRLRGHAASIDPLHRLRHERR